MQVPIESRVHPLVTRPGGKSRMLRRLLPLIEERPHKVYIEAFCGGCAVLLAKPPSQREVINDLDGDLVNLYRQVRHHSGALLHEFRCQVESRREFCDFRVQPGLTEIQRAARYLYRNFYSFGGDVASFAVQRYSFRSRFWMLRKVAGLTRRLNRVTIENVTYQRCLDLYDCKEALVFLDPPYTAGEVRAYSPWGEQDVQGLRDRLEVLKGTWILTVNDCPFNRQVFKGCRLIPVTTAANMRRGSGQRFGELIITPR